ncbi:putative pectinesterase/pectinesterase inhibitor 21 [Drosera capensis]
MCAAVLADHFMARDIGVENTAGAIKHQAVAIRVQADMSIFYNCHFDGYQDTLYAHTYRQFYRDCKISGTIDFVFGDAASFFQNCTFVVRKPLDNQNCIVTAQGRKERHQPTGIIIHKSLFTAEPDYYPLSSYKRLNKYRFKNKAYLARPWKEYSKTIIIESYMEDLIQSDGWLPWMGDFGLDTCYYGEYNNAGPGANMTGRVKWRGVKTIIRSRAEKFMPPIFFGNDNWIRESGVPYIANLTSAPPPESAALPEGIDEDPNAPMASPSTDSQEHKSKSHHNHHKSKSHDIDSIALPPTISSAPSPSPISIETTSYPFTSSIIPLSEAGDQQPILIKDLERVLMEDITEDTEHNDMMSNIPDSNEASPAPADHQRTSNSMAPSSNSPSIAQSPSLTPIQSPTQRDGMADMSGPASSPAPSADSTASSAPEPVPADAVPPTQPTHSGSPSRFRYQVHAILSGLAICAALTM